MRKGRRGRIEIGQLADLIVPNRDFFACAESEIADTTSLLTIVGGKVVYGAGTFSSLDEAAPPPAMPDWSPVRRFGGYGAWGDRESRKAVGAECASLQPPQPRPRCRVIAAPSGRGRSQRLLGCAGLLLLGLLTCDMPGATRAAGTPNWVSEILEWRLVWVAARVALTSAYVLGGLTKLFDFAGAVAEQESFGLHPGWLWASLAIVVELIGSAFVISGRFVWLGAGALGVLTAIATLVANDFLDDSRARTPRGREYVLRACRADRRVSSSLLPSRRFRTKRIAGEPDQPCSQGRERF